MPNGTPFCTGFRETFTDTIVVNSQSVSSPVQTVAQGGVWLQEDYDDAFVKSLSWGSAHSAAIKTDGTLWLWGNNGNGQLGNNLTTNRSSPVQTVSTGTNWKQISLSPNHSAAIKTDGTLWLWGQGNGCQLGNSPAISQSSPVQTLSTGNNWKQVSLAEAGSAAIKTDGTLWLWGQGEVGFLGNNLTTDQSSPVQTISTGNNWKQLSSYGKGTGTGRSATVAAIKTDGTLWLWGYAGSGKLGDNTTTNKSSPVQTVSQGTNWKQVSVGDENVAAIKIDGTLWLWGCGSGGELGNNATTNRSSPVQTISTGNNWKQVDTGYHHSAAIKTDGTLWLWGEGSSGRLGDNTITNKSSPVQTVSTGNDWKQVSAGCQNSSAVKTDGTLWLWGNNGNGQLGNNSPSDLSSPVQTISSGVDWTDASGEESAWCSFSLGRFRSAAIKTDGTLWLWGDGSNGGLGNISLIDQSSPVQTVSTGTNWKQVSLGLNHSASVKTDGTLWLWGKNNLGFLGNNSTIDQSSPVQTVSTGNNWKQVSVTCEHSAAVKTDGTLWLWGSGTSGRLGNNLVSDRSSPVQTVSAGNDWKQVSLGSSHSAAIKTDGTLWLWGNGSNGQLGINQTNDRSSPAQTVSQGNNWKQVSLGCDVSSAIKTDGTLWVWGCNNGGSLGNNSTINISSPIQTVSTGNNWKQVSAGIGTTLRSATISAVKTDGTLWLWGNATNYKLGNNSTIDRSSPVQTVTQGTNWKQTQAGGDHSSALNNGNCLLLWGLNTSGQVGRDGIENQQRTITADLGTMLVEKDYLLDVYPNIDPRVKAPALYAWGRNNYGQLGDNSTIAKSSPVQTVAQGINWEQISYGIGHTGAIKTDGTLWMWGDNASGRLGNNSSTGRSSPVQTVSTGNNWKQLSLEQNTAGTNAHSAAIKNDGTLWLWGAGNSGRLGTNSTIARSSPVQTVSTGTNWKQVSAGGASSAAVKTDGTLWLWGYNASGKLGNSSTINRSSPVQTVSTGTNWKQVSIGNFHSAAIKTDGTLWLWGCGSGGRLGTNDTIAQSAPVQTISSGTNWKQVSLSCLHSGAIKTDGTLWLWGSNNAGSLGNNSTTSSISSPVQTISTGNNWKQLYLGLSVTSAIKTDGTLWLWGRGVCGALGNNSTIDQSSPVQTISSGTNWKQVSVNKAINETSNW